MFSWLLVLQRPPGDPSTSDRLIVPEAQPPAGNHGDQGGTQPGEEEDVGGLINSDGEEERLEPERCGTSPVPARSAPVQSRLK